MSGTILSQIAGLWNEVRTKATATVIHKEADYVLGKVPSRPILDAEGNILVDAGHRIDDNIIHRVTEAGLMHDLTAAVAEAKADDARDHVRRFYEHTPEGQEAKHHASHGSYMEARRYISCIAGLDVTDLKGNVLISAGRRISYEDVVLAREHGQLAALIYSAQQPGPPENLPEDYTSETPAPPAPATAVRPPSRRAPMPFAAYYEEQSLEE